MGQNETEIPEATYEMLMSATYRALCEHGYDDLTMRDIAAKFDKSRPLIHYHYESKEDLLGTAFEWMVDRYEAVMLQEVDQDGSPREMLEAFIDVALEGPADPEFDHWAFFTALLEFRSRAHRNERIRRAVVESYTYTIDLIREILEAGIRAGEIQEVDVDATAHFLFLATDAIRIRYIVNDAETALVQGRTALDELVLASLYTD